jgi:hypothetical protein
VNFTKEEAARAVEDLTATTAVLVKNGWHQGDLYDCDRGLPGDECPVCLIGALRIAAYGGLYTWFPDEAVASARNARAEVAHGYLMKVTGAGDLPDWNDTEGRTVEEVYAALDRAVELAKVDAAC